MNQHCLQGIPIIPGRFMNMLPKPAIHLYAYMIDLFPVGKSISAGSHIREPALIRVFNPHTGKTDSKTAKSTNNAGPANCTQNPVAL